MKILLILLYLSICLIKSDTEINYVSQEEGENGLFGNRPQSNRIRLLKSFSTIKGKSLMEELIMEADNLFQKCPPKQDFLHSIKFHDDRHKNFKCSDPKPSVMMANYVNMHYLFKDLGGMFDIASVQNVFKKYINLDVPITHNQFAFGSKKCNGDSNLTQINEMTICPWHTRIEIRHNRYPYIVTHATCNCGNCLHLTLPKFDAIYKCQPLYRLSPALLRDEKCDPRGGIFEWQPILEAISVTCVCSRSDKLLIATQSDN
jgi:hypothetical protein